MNASLFFFVLLKSRPLRMDLTNTRGARATFSSRPVTQAVLSMSRLRGCLRGSVTYILLQVVSLSGERPHQLYCRFLPGPSFVSNTGEIIVLTYPLLPRVTTAYSHTGFRAANGGGV